jgi:hypothetical protein
MRGRFGVRQSWALVLIAALGICVIASGCDDAKSTTVAKDRSAWGKDMRRLRVPRKGCFKGSYPRVEWRKVPCVKPPNLPYLPAEGPRPFVVGNGTDFAARVPGTISAAEGSFDSVTGVTSETGPEGGTGPGVANVYTLQLNTSPFPTSVCSSDPNCSGWQQYVYSSSAEVIFIQYWLLNYNATCPSGWNPFPTGAATPVHCWRNGAGAAAVAKQPITNLANLRLAGNANSGGNDTVEMFVGTTSATASNMDNILNLANGWKGVEFIVVGDCCGSEATFNSGSTLEVRTTVHHGANQAPECAMEGFTGETNNLNLVGTAAVGPGAAPAIVSRQSNSPGTAASCVLAEGIGDTHLRTFGGLLYDFQAAGDFVLAERGPGFVVQTRQESGAPTWPNAAVNTAVGAKMGQTRVSVCLPGRLEVDGRPTAVAEGSPVRLPGGVDVSRTGSVYSVRGPQGDSLRAQVNNGWIDASVGLGRWPAAVHGLLANPGGNANQLATRDGQILTQPMSFDDLYHRLGDSWRVKQSESFLCGKRVKPSNPAKPFDAEDLQPVTARRARSVCTEAGVKKGPLLEACVLDVAVLGTGNAAKAFVGVPKPVAVNR